MLDRGYLAIQQRWCAEIGTGFEGRIIQIEGDVVVLLETASGKHENAARTLQPKLCMRWDDFFESLAPRRLEHRAYGLWLTSEIDLSNTAGALQRLSFDCSICPVKRLFGGGNAALKRLQPNYAGSFSGYGECHNKPETNAALADEPLPAFRPISLVEMRSPLAQ